MVEMFEWVVFSIVDRSHWNPSWSTVDHLNARAKKNFVSFSLIRSTHKTHILDTHTHTRTEREGDRLLWTLPLLPPPSFLFLIVNPLQKMQQSWISFRCLETCRSLISFSRWSRVISSWPGYFSWKVNDDLMRFFPPVIFFSTIFSIRLERIIQGVHLQFHTHQSEVRVSFE